jgi:hypothetical protein
MSNWQQQMPSRAASGTRAGYQSSPREIWILHYVTDCSLQRECGLQFWLHGVSTTANVKSPARCVLKRDSLRRLQNTRALLQDLNKP